MQKQKNIFIIGLLFSLITLLSACDRSTVFDNEQSIEGSLWKSQDSLNFTFELSDTTHYYNLDLKLRVNSDYPFSNIYLMTLMQGPGGQNISDIKNFELANKQGKWLGEGNSHMASFELPLYANFKLHTPGEYKIKLLQYMRVDQLKGVQNVGIKVRRGNEIY